AGALSHRSRRARRQVEGHVAHDVPIRGVHTDAYARFAPAAETDYTVEERWIGDVRIVLLVEHELVGCDITLACHEARHRAFDGEPVGVEGATLIDADCAATGRRGRVDRVRDETRFRRVNAGSGADADPDTASRESDVRAAGQRHRAAGAAERGLLLRGEVVERGRAAA